MKRTNWYNYDYSISFFNKLFLNKVFKGYLRLLSGAVLPVNPKIMEFGAGTGYASRLLVNKLSPSLISLVDLNKNSLMTLKSVFSDCSSAKVIKGDVTKFDSRIKYDLVYSQGLIEHFQGKELIKVINSHVNAVKKGGYFMFFYPVNKGLYPFWRKILELMNKWIFHDEVPISKGLIIKLIGKRAELINDSLIVPYLLCEEGLLFRKN